MWASKIAIFTKYKWQSLSHLFVKHLGPFATHNIEKTQSYGGEILGQIHKYWENRQKYHVRILIILASTWMMLRYAFSFVFTSPNASGHSVRGDFYTVWESTVLWREDPPWGPPAQNTGATRFGTASPLTRLGYYSLWGPTVWLPPWLPILHADCLPLPHCSRCILSERKKFNLY